jgi:hypothetical protein
VSPSYGLSRPRLLAPLGNGRRDGVAGSGGQCSIEVVRPRLALLGALAGLAVLAARRRRASALDAAPDERALELRRKLDEVKGVEAEREAEEAGEIPIDRAEPSVEERRRRVHARARETADDMRKET